MGLFDRLKKKEQVDSKTGQEVKKPIQLIYKDGTNVDVTFEGSCEVEGKQLHSIRAIYTLPSGNFETKMLLVDPVTRTDNNGQTIDATEEYFKFMTTLDETDESVKRYGAVKGFFKKEEVEKIGMDYIGLVSQKEDGTFYRYYDESFKTRHLQRYKEAQRQSLQETLEKSIASDQEYARQVKQEADARGIHYKTSHAEHLSVNDESYKQQFGEDGLR